MTWHVDAELLRRTSAATLNPEPGDGRRGAHAGVRLRAGRAVPADTAWLDRNWRGRRRRRPRGPARRVRAAADPGWACPSTGSGCSPPPRPCAGPGCRDRGGARPRGGAAAYAGHGRRATTRAAVPGLRADPAGASRSPPPTVRRPTRCTRSPAPRRWPARRWCCGGPPRSSASAMAMAAVAAVLLPGPGWCAAAWLLPALLLCTGTLALATVLPLRQRGRSLGGRGCSSRSAAALPARLVVPGPLRPGRPARLPGRPRSRPPPS